MWKAATTGASGAACSTSILYLLQAGERSRLHRIRQDELWHFHLGGPLRLYCLTPDGQELDRILGADILAGQHLLLPMPGGCWFGAEPCPGTDFSLVSCTVAPGFDFRDFELARAACLVRRYPFAKERIEHFCQLPDGCPDPGEGGRA